MSIKVVITDDHPLAVSGIKTLLNDFKHIEVINTYYSGKALLDGILHQQPDILILDILLPDMSGRELTPLIVKQYPKTRIIAITSLDAPAIVQSMMQSGCSGYLLKGADQQTLLKAIEAVYRGEEYIEPALKEHVMHYMFKNAKHNADVLKLTPREKEILQLIVAEYTTQEIADKLFISFRTIETHRYSLLQKLGAKNIVGLVKIAIKLGLVE